jgi:uncharacterized protein YndB with AHSA1/START domain
MSAIEPIRASVSVRTDPARAFEVFTDRLDSWWPLETHSRAADEFEGLSVERVEFQGRVGGRVLEQLSDGQVLPWGEVLIWEPPHRFVLAWKPNSSPRPPTELEVRFTEHEGGTLVELEHRGWEVLGEVAEEARVSYGEGWLKTLELFARAIDRAQPAER